MTRWDFECETTKERRKIAERQYHIVSKKLFQAEHDKGIFSDEFGPITDIHHCWPRSHCALWYVFQIENLLPMSRELHHIIHTKPRSEMTELEASYFDECEAIKERLIKEDANYHYPQKYHAKPIKTINGDD